MVDLWPEEEEEDAGRARDDEDAPRDEGGRPEVSSLPMLDTPDGNSSPALLL